MCTNVGCGSCSDWSSGLPFCSYGSVTYSFAVLIWSLISKAHDAYPGNPWYLSRDQECCGLQWPSLVVHVLVAAEYAFGMCEVHCDTPFLGHGFASIAVARFADELNSVTPIAGITATSILDHPTVAEFAQCVGNGVQFSTEIARGNSELSSALSTHMLISNSQAKTCNSVMSYMTRKCCF